jgi:transcriptional regulator of acetoin/glycerol metabolism
VPALLRNRVCRFRAAAACRSRWNKTHAAKELGLSRMGLRQKLARFGLEGQADG